jgi:hypothetical protein
MRNYHAINKVHRHMAHSLTVKELLPFLGLIGQCHRVSKLGTGRLIHTYLPSLSTSGVTLTLPQQINDFRREAFHFQGEDDSSRGLWVVTPCSDVVGYQRFKYFPEHSVSKHLYFMFFHQSKGSRYTLIQNWKTYCSLNITACFKSKGKDKVVPVLS